MREMHTRRWSEIMSRITPNDALNIDDVLARQDPRAAKKHGSAVMPASDPVRFSAGFSDESTSVIGFRLREARDDLPVLAMRLAGFAAEQGAEVVILSDLPYSGLERFGFRVERVCGDTEEQREMCVDQLREFWSMGVIL